MLWATPSIQQGPGVRTTRSGEASDAGRVDTSSFCVFVRFSISPSLSSVNSEYWQLLISLRKISQVAFCRCGGFFSVETADTWPVAHAASWSSCDRILREKAQIIRGSGETGLESCFQTMSEMLTLYDWHRSPKRLWMLASRWAFTCFSVVQRSNSI